MDHRPCTGAPIIVIADTPAWFDTLRPLLHAQGYTPLLTHWHDDVSATIAQHQPHAVAIHLSDSTPPTARVLTALQENPAIRHTPVVICSDNSTLLQTAITALRQRPGNVSTHPIEKREDI